FTGAAPVDIILKHLHEAPVPPAEARPDLRIAPGLQEVVLRCMAKGRNDRFQSMDELLVQLKAVRGRLTGAAPQPSSPEPHATTPEARLKASSGPISQTPPTPQPALRTPSQPMGAMRTTPEYGAPSQPPAPPPDAFYDQLTPVRPAAHRAAARWGRLSPRTAAALKIWA